jgi:hypothetical protein
MAHPFPPGTGAAHSFSQITGPHAHPHEHDDLNEIVDDHADHINDHAARLDDHDGRLEALETVHRHHSTDVQDNG